MAKSITNINATLPTTSNPRDSERDVNLALNRLVSRGYVRDNGGAYSITKKGRKLFKNSDRMASFIQTGGQPSFEAIRAALPDIETKFIQIFLEDFVFE